MSEILDYNLKNLSGLSSSETKELVEDVSTLKEDVESNTTRITSLEAAMGVQIKRYGARYYYGQSSPSLTRLYDAEGLTANATHDGAAVTNDFDEEDIFKDIKRVKRDKTTHLLLSTKGDSDYDSVEGEEMVDVPDTYWRFEESEDKTYRDLIVCNAALTGYTKVDKFSIGAYPCSYNDDGEFQTRSGEVALGYMSLTNARTKITSEYGDGACEVDWRYMVLMNLMLIEFASFYAQSTLGSGHSSFRYSTSDVSLLAESGTNRIVIAANNFLVGQAISIGTTTGNNSVTGTTPRLIMEINTYSDDDGITGYEIVFDGDSVTTTTSSIIWSCAQTTGSSDDIEATSGCWASDGKHGVQYRGFEFNSIYDWIDGIYFSGRSINVCTDPTAYTTSIIDDYSTLNYDLCNSNGWQKQTGFDANFPFFNFPTSVGGGSTTYITDYFYQNTGSTSVFAALVSGTPHDGSYCGPFYWYVNGAASSATWFCGCRVLMYQI